MVQAKFITCNSGLVTISTGRCSIIHFLQSNDIWPDFFNYLDDFLDVGRATGIDATVNIIAHYPQLDRIIVSYFSLITICLQNHNELITAGMVYDEERKSRAILER
jgi:hypothetical protein